MCIIPHAKHPSQLREAEMLPAFRTQEKLFQASCNGSEEIPENRNSLIF